MTSTRKTVLLLISALIGATTAGTSLAQDAASYPNRPITIILATQGPGSIDTEYRLYTEAIRRQGGPAYVLDYKGGGGGGIGMAYVAKAPPDGYTLLGAVSSIITVPVINDMGFDNVRDFAHITLFSKRFFMLLVHPASPIKTVKEYIQYARAHPEELNWSTVGIGSSTHMPGELLHSMTNTKVTFVHYKAAAQRLIDLMAGRVNVSAGTPLAALGYVKGGKLRAIGTTGSVRSRIMPDVPTIAESGVPGYEFSTWAGLLAPAKVPPYVVSRNLDAFRAGAKDPQVMKKLESDDVLPVMNSPEEFRQFVIAENKRWGKIIKDAGIKLEESH